MENQYTVHYNMTSYKITAANKFKITGIISLIDFIIIALLLFTFLV